MNKAINKTVIVPVHNDVLDLPEATREVVTIAKEAMLKHHRYTGRLHFEIIDNAVITTDDHTFYLSDMDMVAIRARPAL